MELGATVCSVRKPGCMSCPWFEHCGARKDGEPERYPPKKVKKPRPIIHRRALLHLGHDPERVWLEKQPEDGLFAGLYLPPVAPAEAGDEVDVRHRLTHRDLYFTIVKPRKKPMGDGRWGPIAELPQLGLPSLTMKLLKAGVPHDWELPRVGRRTSG